MARQIQIDDKELIEIVDSAGNVTGTFHWNPSDLDIVKRCEAVMGYFEKLRPLEESSAQEIFRLSEETKAQFDYLLNSPGASDALFTGNVFSPREDGTTQAEYVLDKLTAFIESELNIRMKKTSSRIKRYTKKYEREDIHDGASMG